MHPKAEIEFFQITINAPANQIYRNFTKGIGLEEWLSNGARTRPQTGGMIAMWWNNGYYMMGEFTRLETDAYLSFTWIGRGEPHPSQVQVKISEDDGSSRVEVTHQGLGSEEIWVEPRKAIRKGWEQGLENLKSVLETGRDLRVTNRPGIGIYPVEISAGIVAEYGFPVDKGVILKQVIEGLGAEKAGLRKDDLIVELDGSPVTTIESIFHILSKQTLGNQIQVVYYRGSKQFTTTIELMRLPVPEVPESYEDFVNRLETIYRTGYQNLKESVAMVSDEAASWKPAPEEWSIKEALAHLIHTERDNQFWIHSKILDEEFEWLNNTPERGTATVAVYPTLEKLLEEINLAQLETLAFVKNMPEKVKNRKNTYWNLAQGILTADSHIQEHIDQINQNLESYQNLQKS